MNEIKAIGITLNWVLSFFGLCIDTETAPMWAVLVVLAWFAGSCLLMRWADRKGMFKQL